MNFSSRLLEDAIHEFGKLPGVGRKTSVRYVLHLLRLKDNEVYQFAESLVKLKKEIQYCKICYNISEHEICAICTDVKRDNSVICVVEDIRDVIALENTQQYFGLYHVLNGIISPLDGIGPNDLTIEPLVERVNNGEVKELIMALRTTMEGDTTNFYIYRRLKGFPISFSMIARGIALGDDLEYADEITLGRSIKNRVSYDSQFK